MEKRENLQRDIATLEQALGDALEETGKAERALDELEGRRNEAAGRVEIARQAAINYGERLEERRQALARTLEAEAQARLLEAVEARDDAANRAAEAIAHLIASFERLDAARAATADLVAETEPHLRPRAEVGPEPEELEQEWRRLVDFVGGRAQLLLDDELVEAAASSPGGFDIDKLPQDLQVIARRRRTERLRAANPKARSKRDS
jgi:chromosome segregation ATPase